MKPLPLSRIAQWTGGRLVGTGAAGLDVLIDTITTDTRTLDASDGRAALFVAIRGERFDGNAHVADAALAGARAVLVSIQSDDTIPQVVVPDTERALAAFAAALQHTRTGQVIAITGSNGKTSVKAMLLSILQRVAVVQGRSAYANPGNRNNEIGLPLAVLDAPEDAQFAIYEMGAGKPGDIAYLTAIARPDVALVNNVAPAHLERMGNLLGVADTKGAIYDALPSGGVAVINADDAFAPYFAERAHGRRLIRFGLEATADVSARDVTLHGEGSRFVLVTEQGEVNVVLSLPGRHNVLNALAAASLALGAGASPDAIADGLMAARAVAGRLVTHRLPSGATLIDDSYNANPGSLNAAIDLLAGGGGEQWLVLGDMRELGADAQALHAEAGRRAGSAGITRLFTLGPLSAAAADAFGTGGVHFDSHAALAEALRAAMTADIRVLVKGSRGSAMEQVVRALLAPAGDTDAA
ncbi:MAG: UDP-N-acetylmuramoyl-tripeptide--D-alanyl-D-alanine ligase [Luteimonas sp.]